MSALLIFGPTASGKSALALALARRLGGEIVNADSMQVYRDLRVLTARPDDADLSAAPHHLYGVVDAAERYSTGRWLKDVAAAVAEIAARGSAPILVGGTGLYFKALTEGLAAAPAIDPNVRAALARALADEGVAAMHARLAARHPVSAARIRPSDSARVMRALELAESGVDPALLETRAQPLLRSWRGLALAPDRAALYARIERRFAAMLAGGALEEARALFDRALDPALPAMKAHGMPHFSAYFRGEISLEAVEARAARDTRRYAKRQFTWMAHQLQPAWRVLIPPQEEADIAALARTLRLDGADADP